MADSKSNVEEEISSSETAPGVYSIGDGKFVNYDGIECRRDGRGINGEDLSDKSSALDQEKRRTNELEAKIAELTAELAKKK